MLTFFVPRLLIYNQICHVLTVKVFVVQIEFLFNGGVDDA